MAPTIEVHAVVGDFERALPFILQFEGGYVNDPDDPGGATNKGITQATYDRYRDSLGLARHPVKGIADHEVSDIYENHYWAPLGCDEKPWPYCLALVDAGVNHGIGRAKKFASLTQNAEELIRLREAFYHRIVANRPASKKFLKGWLRRMALLRQEVQRVA